MIWNLKSLYWCCFASYRSITFRVELLHGKIVDLILAVRCCAVCTLHCDWNRNIYYSIIRYETKSSMSGFFFFPLSYPSCVHKPYKLYYTKQLQLIVNSVNFENWKSSNSLASIPWNICFNCILMKFLRMYIWECMCTDFIVDGISIDIDWVKRQKKDKRIWKISSEEWNDRAHRIHIYWSLIWIIFDGDERCRWRSI